MIYDEYKHGKDASNYINNSDLDMILGIYENNNDDDLVICFQHKVDMVSLFRGIAKSFCIMSKFTKKDTDTLIETLKKAIEIEKTYDSKE